MACLGRGEEDCLNTSSPPVIPDVSIQHSQCYVPLIDFFRAWKKIEFHPILWASCSPESHFAFFIINYLLVLVDDLIVQNDLPSHRCHLGKYKALKDYCPTRKFTGPWLPNGTFFEPCFVFLYFVILFLLFFPIHLLQVLLPQLPFTWKTSSGAFVTSAHG